MFCGFTSHRLWVSLLGTKLNTLTSVNQATMLMKIIEREENLLDNPLGNLQGKHTAWLRSLKRQHI
jgi:hypothetical protein